MLAELAKLAKAESAKIDPAVARWAAEAAAMVKDQQAAADGAQELTNAGWKESAAGTSQVPLTEVRYPTSCTQDSQGSFQR